jgi:hypothetical protein
MYTEQRINALEAGVAQIDRRTGDLERLTVRLADAERLTEAAADVNVLLALITDPAAAKKRLAELVKATAEVEAGRAKLAADRAAHEREVAEAKAGLDRRQARVSEGEVELRLRLNANRAVKDAPEPVDRFPFSPNFEPGTRAFTGLAREAE